MCACMCGKGNIAVNKGEQQTKSAVKCLRHSISIYKTNQEIKKNPKHTGRRRIERLFYKTNREEQDGHIKT